MWPALKLATQNLAQFLVGLVFEEFRQKDQVPVAYLIPKHRG
jgi:hypothetical protein